MGGKLLSQPQVSGLSTAPQLAGDLLSTLLQPKGSGDGGLTPVSPARAPSIPQGCPGFLKGSRGRQGTGQG